MNCKKYEKWMNLFWDKRLSKGQEEEFKKHLANCQECQRKLAFLESVEGKAKEIHAKEPPQEYWDNFSRRVREKIIVSREESAVFGWRKTFADIFSPWKVKIATAVVSILLVFIIGKLYVDYRGKTIIPHEPVVPQVKEAPLSITETEKGKIPPPEEAEAKISPQVEQQKKAPPLVSSDQEKEKVVSPVVESAEKLAGLKEQGIDLSDRTKEQKSISVPTQTTEGKQVVPGVKPQPEETPPPVTEQPVSAEAVPTAGAGGEKKVEKPKEEFASSPAEKTREGTKLQEALAPGKGVISKDITSAAKTSLISAPSGDVIRLHEKSIPRIKETDTLMQADELKNIIQIWKDHFKDNPTDSINDQGYLQVAAAYLLLNRLSPDTILVNQGSSLIEQYMNRTKDPAIREQLSDKLEKMKSLGKK